MSNAKGYNAALPLMGASGLLLAGAASHHVLLGAVCAAVVFLGLLLRDQPGRRALGRLLILAGGIGFCLMLLFGTGASLGRDMAARDAALLDGH